MHHTTLRSKVDQLVIFAVQIYQFLESYEQNLIQNARQDLGAPDESHTNTYIRKRVLRYLIGDHNQTQFQALWMQYQNLFRELYRDFHIRSASTFQDELFASREILEDTLMQPMDTDTFRQAFLQKAYLAFGVDFVPIQGQIRENNLFDREAEESSENDEMPTDFEDETSHVCRIM